MPALILSYALCFVAIKAGLSFAPALLFAGLRALLGGIALLILLPVLHIPILPNRSLWLWIVAVGLASTTFTYGAMFLSPGRTGAGIASVLGNLQPLIVIVMATVFLGERMTRRTGAALVLGLLGVILIASPALVGPGAYGLLGAVLALAASGGAAAGSVIVKRMGHPSAILIVSGWQLVLGSLPLLALSPFLEPGRMVVWTGEFVGLLLFLGLIGTAFPTAAWFRLVQHGDVGRLSLFLFLVPVFGLLIAAAVFRERVQLVSVAGIVVTVTSIIPLLSGRDPQRRSLDQSVHRKPTHDRTAIP